MKIGYQNIIRHSMNAYREISKSNYCKTITRFLTSSMLPQNIISETELLCTRQVKTYNCTLLLNVGNEMLEIASFQNKNEQQVTYLKHVTYTTNVQSNVSRGILGVTGQLCTFDHVTNFVHHVTNLAPQLRVTRLNATCRLTWIKRYYPID